MKKLLIASLAIFTAVFAFAETDYPSKDILRDIRFGKDTKRAIQYGFVKNDMDIEGNLEIGSLTNVELAITNNTLSIVIVSNEVDALQVFTSSLPIAIGVWSNGQVLVYNAVLGALTNSSVNPMAETDPIATNLIASLAIFTNSLPLAVGVWSNGQVLVYNAALGALTNSSVNPMAETDPSATTQLTAHAALTNAHGGHTINTDTGWDFSVTADITVATSNAHNLGSALLPLGTGYFETVSVGTNTFLVAGLPMVFVFETGFVYSAISASALADAGVSSGAHTVDTVLSTAQVETIVSAAGYTTGAHTVDTVLSTAQVETIVSAAGYVTGAHTVKYTDLEAGVIATQAVANSGHLSAEVDGNITNEQIVSFTLDGSTGTITEASETYSVDLTPAITAVGSDQGYLTVETDPSATTQLSAHAASASAHHARFTTNEALTAVSSGGYVTGAHTVKYTDAEAGVVATNSITTHAGDADAHHAQSHNIASHSDTTATGAELETLTDGSNADSLHAHPGGGGASTNTEVSATGNTTRNSGTYALMDSMTITPASGTYMVIVGTSVVVDGETANIAIFAGGTEIAHTERTANGNSGVNDTFPMTTHGKATVNGAEAIELRWNTAGGSVTAGERTMNIWEVQ